MNPEKQKLIEAVQEELIVMYFERVQEEMDSTWFEGDVTDADDFKEQVDLYDLVDRVDEEAMEYYRSIEDRAYEILGDQYDETISKIIQMIAKRAVDNFDLFNEVRDRIS